MMYAACNCVIESEISLGDLTPTVGQAADIRIACAPERGATDAGDHCKDLKWSRSLENRRPAMMLYRGDDGYRLTFPSVAEFRITAACTLVECAAEADASAAAIARLLVDQVIPRILGQRGALILHASAVELPEGGCVVFLGRSRSGKSSLAAEFCRHGAQLLADDVLALKSANGELATVTYADCRPRAIEVRGLVVLRPSMTDSHEAVRVARLSGRKAIMAILDAAFILDPCDRESISRLFARAGGVAAIVEPVCSLTIRHRRWWLAEAREAISAALGCNPPHQWRVSGTTNRAGD